jgi:hypothetical protein
MTFNQERINWSFFFHRRKVELIVGVKVPKLPVARRSLVGHDSVPSTKPSKSLLYKTKNNEKSN